MSFQVLAQNIILSYEHNLS